MKNPTFFLKENMAFQTVKIYPKVKCAAGFNGTIDIVEYIFQLIRIKPCSKLAKENVSPSRMWPNLLKFPHRPFRAS
jgi:hypothetical protein